MNGKAPASPTNVPNGTAGKKEEVKYLSFEKPSGEPKKIMGGQKFSENGSQKDKKDSENGSMNDSALNSNNVNP